MKDEEKAEEYAKINCGTHPNQEDLREAAKYAYLAGLAEGRKETEKQWHDCFLSCSSPYCAGHFPAVKMQGELGNMSKREEE